MSLDSLSMSADVGGMLRQISAEPSIVSPGGLMRALRLLTVWRSRLLAAEIVRRHGAVVQDGPFAGMVFRDRSEEGCVAAKLLGCYEAALQPVLAELGPVVEAVVDIGCAEGYYAVGLAPRLPGVVVHAHDTNPAAQAACPALAAANGVAERVVVGGAFAGADFVAFAGRRSWVIVDIEGHEAELLRPDLHPALLKMSLIVECHDLDGKDVSGALSARFAPSHSVERLEAGLPGGSLPDWLVRQPQIDQLLALWEWRSGPTPWLVMRPR